MAAGGELKEKSPTTFKAKQGKTMALEKGDVEKRGSGSPKEPKGGDP